MATTITPTRYEKDEWSRMAQAAYAEGANQAGHRYSVAASLPSAAQITAEQFDGLQRGYREWLISGSFPQIAA